MLSTKTRPAPQYHDHDGARDMPEASDLAAIHDEQARLTAAWQILRNAPVKPPTR